MPRYTGLWDSTTRLHLYVTVLLTFYILKKQQIFSSLSFYKHYYLLAAIKPRGLYLRFAGEE